MAVHQTASTASKTVPAPLIAASISAPSSQHHANANSAGYTARLATPSRDSQELRHCEKARQARSGRPRWNSDAISPLAVSTVAVVSEVTAKPLSVGIRPAI